MNYIISKKLSLFVILSAFIFVNCEQDSEEINQQQTLTQEIEKIETIFKEGDIKIENDLSEEKIETLASPELKAKLETELLKSYTKQTTYSKTSALGFVGVFRDGSCGSYEELYVKMDCEDRRTNSYQGGYTADSGVVDAHHENVVFRFCFVPNSFNRTTYDFAVLNVSSTVPSGISRITRHFDNEDNRNGNILLRNNVRKYGFTKIGSNYFYKNTILSFLYYPRVSRTNTPPSLGFPYGVLGRFGNAQGYIRSDDEDSKNANWCKILKYNDATNRYNQETSSGNITNIMDVGSNTKLYISRINN